MLLAPRMSRPAFWISTVFFAALVLTKFNPASGFTSLIRFGEKWQDRRHSALQNLPIATVPESYGYDGQFYAQIALDPLLRSPELTQAVDQEFLPPRQLPIVKRAGLHGDPG